jgi:glycosyltransferase involved in cell wall biosynthesis
MTVPSLHAHSRILVIAEMPPLPAIDGARLRIASILRALAQHSVDLVHLYLPDETVIPVECELPHCRTIATVQHDSRLTNWSRLRSMFSSCPNGTMRTSSQAMRRILQDVSAGDYDAALLCGLNMVQYADCLRFKRMFVDLCDSELRHMEVRSQFVSNPLKKVYFWRQHKKVVRHISDAALRFNSWFVISDIERLSLLSHFPDLSVHVVPNSIQIPTGTCSPASGAGPITLTGNFDFSPNVDAALHFVRETMPLLQARAPSSKLRILGKNPPPPLAKLQSEHVEVTGFVKNFHALLSEASVYVCPLRYGTGIKNKVLEAMALGVPTVSTPIGVECLGAVDGIHYLSADTPVQFVNAITRLARDENLRRGMATAGRDLILSTFGSDAVRVALDNAIAASGHA